MRGRDCKALRVAVQLYNDTTIQQYHDTAIQQYNDLLNYHVTPSQGNAGSLSSSLRFLLTARIEELREVKKKHDGKASITVSPHNTVCVLGEWIAQRSTSVSRATITVLCVVTVVYTRPTES